MLRPYAHKPRRIAPEMVSNLLDGFGAPHNHALRRADADSRLLPGASQLRKITPRRCPKTSLDAP
jgi:hypothetical protein